MRRLKSILLVSLLLVLFFFPLIEKSPNPPTWWSGASIAQASPAWLSDYTYRKAITVDHTFIDANLTNFILYVKFTNDADIGDHALATGHDIRFTTDDEITECAFWRRTWSGGGGADASGEFSVRVPLLYGAQNSTIYIYYGNPSASDASSPEATFPTADGWVAIWGLEESGNPYLDATTNNNDSTAGVYPAQVTGQVGFGQDFELGSSNRIIVTDSDSLDIGTSDFLITAWINPETISIDQCLISHKQFGNYVGYTFLINASNRVQGVIRDALGNQATVAVATYTVSAGTFQHVGLICDRSSTTGFNSIYNGVIYGNVNPTAVGDISTTRNLGISTGDVTSPGSYFDGIIDEPRIFVLADITTINPAAWVKFEYNNIFQADNEISFGPETVDTYQFVTDVSALDVNEGSTNVFQVKLSKDPEATVNVTVSRASGNSHISVQSGSTLTFTSVNWDTYQTVTLACEQHTDQPGKVATIRVHDEASVAIDKNVTTTEVYVYAKYWYVRPLGGAYGSEDGTSYANAWDGLQVVTWGASGVSGARGDTLWVCGLHLWNMTQRFVNFATQAEITVTESGTEDSWITIRGDYSGDPGVIWGAYKIGWGTWVDEGSNAYSHTEIHTSATDFNYEDITASSHVLLDVTSSLAECQANAHSFYYDAANTTLYVHCTDGGDPTGRIANTSYGYRFLLTDLSYIKFKNLSLYDGSRMFAGTTFHHVTWDGNVVKYRNSFDLDVNYHDITITGCDISTAFCGIDGSNGLYDSTFSYNKIYDIGVRASLQNSDAHAIGAQSSVNIIIEYNEMYDCGSGPCFWTPPTNPVTDNIVRYNYIHDLHQLGGAGGRGIQLNVDNNDEDQSGNKIYGNIIVGTGVSSGIETQYRSFVEIYNNVVYGFNNNFSFTRDSGTTYGLKLVMKNNISISPTTWHVYFNDQYHVAGTGDENCYIISDYNIFYPISGNQFYFKDSAGAHTVNFTNWQALVHTGSTYDPNSKIEDPKFVNPDSGLAAGFQIGENSPAVDAGIDIGLLYDYWGKSILANLPPDIGAHEWGIADERLIISPIIKIVKKAIKRPIKR